MIYVLYPTNQNNLKVFRNAQLTQNLFLHFLALFTHNDIKKPMKFILDFKPI